MLVHPGKTKHMYRKRYNEGVPENEPSPHERSNSRTTPPVIAPGLREAQEQTSSIKLEEGRQLFNGFGGGVLMIPPTQGREYIRLRGPGSKDFRKTGSVRLAQQAQPDTTITTP